MPISTATDADETTDPTPPQPPHYAPLAEGGSQHGHTSMFAMATYAAAIGLVLAVIGFLSYAYYYESVLSPTRDFDELRSLFDIAKIAGYASMFSWVAMTLGVVLAVKGFMDCGFESASAILKNVDLKSVLRLMVLGLGILVVVTAVTVLLSELEFDIGNDAMRLLSRLLVHGRGLASVIEAIVLFIVTNGLRKASP